MDTQLHALTSQEKRALTLHGQKFSFEEIGHQIGCIKNRAEGLVMQAMIKRFSSSLSEKKPVRPIFPLKNIERAFRVECPGAEHLLSFADEDFRKLLTLDPYFLLNRIRRAGPKTIWGANVFLIRRGLWLGIPKETVAKLP